MPREFLLPDLGEGIHEAQIIRVLVKPGETIKEDQYLMEVETDKAAVEIPSPFSGVAKQIHVKEGQTVNVGQVIVTFDDGAVAPAAPKPAQTSAPASAPVPAKTTPAAPPISQPTDGKPAAAAALGGKTTAAAAPAVRKMAREAGIDIDSLSGSGPGGRVTKEDVEKAAAAPAGAKARTQAFGSASAPAATLPVRKDAPPAAPPPGIADADKWGPIRRQPLNQIRKTIAAQMSRSAFTIPHVTHGDEADITGLDGLRGRLNDATGGDPKLTFMPFLIKALCIALRRYPIFNASFDHEGEQVIYKDYVNVGIAVDTERGLIVPVIRDADKLTLRGIANALRSIADRVRTNQFAIDDLRGGTFTVTNVGALGGTFSTPIINYPEVAILGLGRSRKVPVLREGKSAEAMMLPLALSFDHRATDGANAARFTREIIGYLETPEKFLLD